MIGYRKDRFAPTDNLMFAADPLALVEDPFRFASPGTCFGPLAALPAMGYVALATTAATTAMTIIGGAQQAQAQREQGQIAYQNALLRRQQAYAQASQEQVNAGQQIAAGQRQQLEAQRRGQVMAGRARAVMAASGAGEDEKLISSLVGEGNYQGDVAAFNANERGRGLMNQAAMDRWSGDAGVFSGSETQSADNRAADATLFGAVGKGVTGAAAGALSFADKYGGGAPNGSGFGTDPGFIPGVPDGYKQSFPIT